MRECVSSGSPLEKPIGFSRAVRIGNMIAVSGTAAIAPDGTTACLDDVYGQTKCCIRIMIDAVEKAGGKAENIIRTRIRGISQNGNLPQKPTANFSRK
jgi:enamine deaminase RidA (YjgF/YER057c/UK114 family)